MSLEEVPGGGTAVTALQTAQHTDDAPTGYSKRFRQPEQTSWLCVPENITELLLIGGKK